jgi:DNA-binding IclR family transcriptional regulator
MVLDPRGKEPPPSPETVFDALDDEDCRTIVGELEGEMTASELAEEGDLALSTTYRKLDLLTESSLLETRTELRPDGHHTTRYRIGFEVVSVALDERQAFEISVTRPAREPEERLADLWSEVRQEI